MWERSKKGILEGDSQFVATKLTFGVLTPLKLFAEGVFKEPYSLFVISPPYLYVLHLNWCGKLQILGLSFVQFASLEFCTFGFTLFWAANCFSAEPWIEF